MRLPSIRKTAAAPPLILAAEESSGIDLLLPETSELVAGIIAFAIIFFFVWRWVGPTLSSTLARRQEAERSRLEAAEEQRAEAEELATQYRERLAGAKDEAARIVDEARRAAEAVRMETVSRAQQEADDIISRARAEAEMEAQRALEAARSQVANLSIDLATKVVENSLDRETQLGLVNSYLAELESGN